MSLYVTFREMLVAAGCDPEVAHELLSGTLVMQQVQRWRFWYEEGLVSWDEYIKFLNETYEACK